MRKSVLKIGARLFYPPHGVVRVLGVEEREIADGAQSFYVLALQRGQVLLPVDKALPDGVRKLVSPTKARALLKLVALRPDPDVGEKPSAESCADMLQRGAPDDYTELLRTLLHRTSGSRLSANERRVLRAARNYFINEISVVLDRPATEIEEALR